jgi:Ras-related GTP-binding protein C/D
VDFLLAAQSNAPSLHLEVFVHKSDTMSDTHYRLETFRQIQQQVAYELSEFSDAPAPVIHYALTSVFDTSIHDAFSRALHRVLPSLPFLEDMLNMFCTHSHAQKAFLFDVHTCLYVATDATPVDAATLAWCIDYLRLLSSFSRLYPYVSCLLFHMTLSYLLHRSQVETPGRMRALAITPSPASSTPPPPPVRTHSSSRIASPSNTPRAATSPLPLLSPAPPPAPLPPSPSALHPSLPPSPLNGPPSANGSSPLSTPTSNGSNGTPHPDPSSSTAAPPRPLFAASAHASVAPTTSHASPSAISALAFHAAGETLALVSVLPVRIWPAKRALIEYNVVWLREGVREIVREEWAARGGGSGGGGGGRD